MRLHSVGNHSRVPGGRDVAGGARETVTAEEILDLGFKEECEFDHQR